MLREIFCSLWCKLRGSLSGKSKALYKISIRNNPYSQDGDCCGYPVFIALNTSQEDEKIFSDWLTLNPGIKGIVIPNRVKSRNLTDDIISGLQRDMEEAVFTYIGSLSKLQFHLSATPLIMGPGCRNDMIADDIRTLGGGFIIDDATGFSRIANRLLRNPEERRIRALWTSEYLTENKGIV